MSDLNFPPLQDFPEAAVLLSQGRIAAANPMARHYLPQLEPGAAAPGFLPLDREGPAAGTFTAGLTTYSFSLSPAPEGQWLLFRPAPQSALTDGQLDGALRQLRSLMAELLLTEEHVAPEGRAAFHKNFYRMFRLMDNLDCMRLANSPEGLPFQPATMDLAGLCSQTIDSAAPLLREAGITLEYRSALSSLLIPGDSKLLQRLLLELIANSARVVGQGTILLRLGRRGGHAVLSLSDSGRAATPRQLASMLQQDTDGKLPAPSSGAGLGLPIARHIAALHGGSLLVEWGQSSPTVVLSLPTGPLDGRVTVKTPALQRDGGLSPLLAALSDVLPLRTFELAELD